MADVQPEPKPSGPRWRRLALRFLGAAALIMLAPAALGLGLIDGRGTLRVHLSDARGRPLACVFVLPEPRALWRSWPGADGVETIGVATDMRGDWERRLPPGSYTVQVLGSSGPAPAELTVLPWRTTSLELQVQDEALDPQALSCTARPPLAPTAASSALASPSPAASPTAPPTPTAARPAVSPSPLPPTVAPTLRSTEAVPAGLSGAIAYVDTTCALVTIDLAAGDRRARPLPPTETALDAPPCIIDEAARERAGAPAVTPASAGLPQGGLRARSGEEAWVEPFTEDALLHVRDPATGDERTYPLNLNGPSDRFFGLIAYVADDRRLLAQQHYGNSGAMTRGFSLALLDPHTGARHDIGVVAHQMPETIAINPVASELVAIISSYAEVAGQPIECGLLVLDASTADKRCLTGEPASTPLWSPDGATLAYATHAGTIALAAPADLAAPPLVRPAGGPQTGLLAWLSPTQLLYVTTRRHQRARVASCTSSTPPRAGAC